MAESHNRTLICSVLFVDIVEYSRKPVIEQIALKERFNALLSESLRGVAVNDRIILDTGDGAAISFIGDPEDALFVAADLRDAITKDSGARDLDLSTRIGINLGPVRLVKDINGQPNIIGDGINVAQRVMTFAKPGQVLVSRSYYEVVSRLSDESAKLFTYEGARTDKHIREHEVYAVGDIAALRRRAEDERGSTAHARFALPKVTVPRAVSGAARHLAMKPRVATAVAVCAILALAIAGRLMRGAPEDTPAGALEVANLADAAPASVAAPALVAAENPLRAADQPGLEKKASKQANASQKPRSARDEPPMPEPKRGMTPAAPARVAQVEERNAETPVRAAEQPATMTFAISPWGQIYLNGKMRGVSPPLQELEIPPGKYRVEVRNSASAAHVVSVEAKSGERLRIKHKFE